MTTQARAARPRPDLRRRLDNLVLRWQARLDAAWADRVVPWAAAGLLFVLWFVLALARADSLDAGQPLAAYSQAAWLIARGDDPQLTVTGMHLLAARAPFIMYPIAWLTKVLPTVPTLLGVQAAALAVGVVPLWRLARRVSRLRVGAAVALAIAYGAHPYINDLNLADFHPETLALGPLIAATYMGLTRRWGWFALLCTFVVLCNGELGLVVAGLGAVLMLEGHRRAGLRTVVLGVAWTVVAVVVFQQRYGGSGLVAPGAFADYGDNPFGVMSSMITNPLMVLGDLFAETNLSVLIGLLAPLLFLPVLAPRYLLPALPLQFLYLVADVPLEGVRGAQLTVPAIAFSFVAASFALARIGRRNVERVMVDRRVLIALVAASLGFFALNASNSPYREPWTWGGTDRADEVRRLAVDRVGDRRAVRASPSVLPLLAERVKVYPLEAGERPDVDDVLADGVVAIVIDARQVPDWSVAELVRLSEQLGERGMDLVSRNQRIWVYIR